MAQKSQKKYTHKIQKLRKNNAIIIKMKYAETFI